MAKKTPLIWGLFLCKITRTSLCVVDNSIFVLVVDFA